MPATAPARRIGLLAGGGAIPIEIAERLSARRVPVFVVAIDGEAEPGAFSAYAHATANWGQIGRMLELFRDSGTTDILIVGRVSRPDLGRITPDLGLVRALPAVWRMIRAGGDDAVLREVIGFFEGRGFRVAGIRDVAPELIVGAGAIGAAAPRAEDMHDITAGMALVERLGALDIGQAVVVADGRLEAIEGVEGTDRMLARVAELRHRSGRAPARASPHGVLVKRPQPGQELRIDLPAIGPETVRRAAEAGLAGIAVLAGHTVAAERRELVLRADALRLFVVGIEGAVLGRCRDARSRDASELSPLIAAGRTRPTASAAADARRGMTVIGALAGEGIALAVVVVRRHVLAIEAGEGSLGLIRRAADLRQWGGGRSRRRGVAVLQSGVELGPPVVEAAAAAGLEGLVIVVPPGRAKPSLSEAQGAAERCGLFLATAAHGSGGGADG